MQLEAKVWRELGFRVLLWGWGTGSEVLGFGCRIWDLEPSFFFWISDLVLGVRVHDSAFSGGPFFCYCLQNP